MMDLKLLAAVYLAGWIDTTLRDQNIIVMIIALLSAVVENVSLDTGTMAYV